MPIDLAHTMVYHILTGVNDDQELSRAKRARFSERIFNRGSVPKTPSIHTMVRWVCLSELQQYWVLVNLDTSTPDMQEM